MAVQIIPETRVNSQPPSALARLGEWLERQDRWILPGPAIMLVVLMLAFPVGFNLYMSFHEWSGGIQPPSFIGVDNYSRMLKESRFWEGIGRTAYFVILAVGSQLVLGVISALIFHKEFLGRGVARSIFMFPMIATPAAMALVWKMLLDPGIGALSYYIKAVGGPLMMWTADPQLVIPSLVMVDTWQWTPLVMIIVLAGLAALPREPYEAARVDGASSLQIFFYITLPLLRPVLMVAAMFRMIDAIKTFDIIMVITGGGPSYASETLNLFAFSEGLSYFHLGYGSTLLVALAVLVVSVALAFNRIRRGGYFI